MFSSTNRELLCGKVLHADELNQKFGVDVQKYAIFVSALIVVYRLLTRSRLMSRQVRSILTMQIICLIPSVHGSTVNRSISYFRNICSWSSRSLEMRPTWTSFSLHHIDKNESSTNLSRKILTLSKFNFVPYCCSSM